MLPNNATWRESGLWSFGLALFNHQLNLSTKTVSSTEKNFHVVEHVKRSSKSPQFSRLSSLHEGEGLILFSHTESIAADRIELYGRLHCSKLKHFKRSLWSHLITCCTEASHFYSLLTVWQKSVTHWMWNLCGFHIIFRKNILLN